MILKLIGMIYAEHLSHNSINLSNFNWTFKLKESLIEYIVGHMHYQYGIDEMANKKINQLIKGLIKNQDCPRIALFYSFLNPHKTETGSFELYLRALQFLTMY